MNPVGLLESPAAFRSSPRSHSLPLRAVAAAVALSFLAVATAGTVLTLGSYCLTSHAGAPAPFTRSTAPPQGP